MATNTNGTPPDNHESEPPPTIDDRLSSIPGPGSLIDGKYRVETLIARGGMGVVYAATHAVSKKRVALKWMLPALGQIRGARERFIQEACATARIAHPNIVDIYDVGTEQGSAYLVMEYLRGETLADRMCRQRLTVMDTVALLMPALRGVAAAHSQGVIHRDLKPENIFLCCTEQGEELEPKVLDFGISKITTDEVQNLALTHSGAVLGTPYYMSPEQVRGSRDVDARADIYAIGVILFEALTGERPFDAETYNELILKIATEPMPDAAALNPELDPRLIAIVERAMAREPKDRFPDIKSLALALEPFAGGVRFRSMSTLSPREAVSGDFLVAPIAAATPAELRVPSPAAAASPQHSQRELASDSELELHAVRDRQGSHRGRVALASTILGLLACSGAAVYFLSRPAPPPTAAEHAAAALGSKEAPAEDKNAITAAPQEALDKSPEVNAAHAAPSVNQAVVARAPYSPPSASPNLNSSVLKNTSTSNSKQRPTHTARNTVGVGNAAPEVPRGPATPSGAHSLPLPSDWDRRLDQLNDKTGAPVHMPAGRINMNDFR